MDSEKQKEIILDYLEKAHSGAHMMRDVEIEARLERAIIAFNADISKDIFKEDFIEDYITSGVRR